MNSTGLDTFFGCLKEPHGDDTFEYPQHMF